MGIKRCKLRKKTQFRLLENFVLEATARSAANLHGLHPNTVALFYRKIRAVIAENLEAEGRCRFWEKSNSTKANCLRARR